MKGACIWIAFFFSYITFYNGISIFMEIFKNTSVYDPGISINWNDLVHLWKYSNMHLVHVIRSVNSGKLENKWYYDEDTQVSLKEMIIDYLSHLQLHLDEINALISDERIKNN